jgi:hypothetical protein
MENGRKSSVAATFEKANTYVFAETVVHNPKVAGSSPAPATNFLLILIPGNRRTGVCWNWLV